MKALNISIVVPFFDTPALLFIEMLRSLKALDPFEVILVDDCSSDIETITI